MEHLAIMRKDWGLTEKILTGEKRIESRWYKVRYPPWDGVKPGETIYFKNSGEPVTIKAEVDKVMQFPNLTPKEVQDILTEYGSDDGIEKERIPEFFELFRNKKYCVLIFLKNPQKAGPFEIDKRGFGSMSSWITVDSISKISRMP